MDSNAEPGALAHKTFLEDGVLRDGWAGFHKADPGVMREPTFHNYEGDTFHVPEEWAEDAWPQSLLLQKHKSCHIDWILHTGGLQPIAADVDHTSDKTSPSLPASPNCVDMEVQMHLQFH